MSIYIYVCVDYINSKNMWRYLIVAVLMKTWLMTMDETSVKPWFFLGWISSIFQITSHRWMWLHLMIPFSFPVLFLLIPHMGIGQKLSKPLHPWFPHQMHCQKINWTLILVFGMYPFFGKTSVRPIFNIRKNLLFRSSHFLWQIAA